MYYVFLDIDGVLASARTEASDGIHHVWDKFDPIAIDFFNRIHDNHDVRFVLSSTWRDHLDINNVMIFHWVKAAFRSSGFRGEFDRDWKVNPENDIDMWRAQRAVEIREYLKTHDYEDFLIFDDSDYNFNKVLGIKRHVKTDSLNGVLTKHMEHALSIMGNWKKKHASAGGTGGKTTNLA